MRELIRKDQDRGRLRSLLIEGAASAPTAVADADYFEALWGHIRHHAAKLNPTHPSPGVPGRTRKPLEAVECQLQEAGDAIALRSVDAVEKAFFPVARHPASGSPRYALELELLGARCWPVNDFPCPITVSSIAFICKFSFAKSHDSVMDGGYLYHHDKDACDE